MNSYLDHQDKLIKIFNQKQKVMKGAEHEQTAALQDISKRSEAFGDCNFATFANKLMLTDN